MKKPTYQRPSPAVGCIGSGMYGNRYMSVPPLPKGPRMGIAMQLKFPVFLSILEPFIVKT